MTTASKTKVLAIFGPTACGKTALLSALFGSGQAGLGMPATVVSADSIQVYKGLDIGSAKPDAATLAALPHELLDIRQPHEAFSLGDFVCLADEACRAAAAAGRLPVLSGGTAYYIKAFLFGLPAAPPADPVIRAALQAELEAGGLAGLRAELEACDPESFRRIAPADTYRLLRALEVYRGSGRPLSSYRLPEEPREAWDLLSIGLDRPRDELYSRIDRRVDQMFSAGLVEELRRLRAAGCTADTTAMKGIGYAEFFNPELEGLGEEQALEAIRCAIKLHSRRYAKRQLTFMRSLPGVHWLPADDHRACANLISAWYGA